MSKLVVVNYRISDAQARETRRKIALVRSILERCVKIQKELAKLEKTAGEDWSATLDKFRRSADANRWDDFVGDYNRLYDELPLIEQQLEKALSDTKAKRLRLELAATTLIASCTNDGEKRQLDALVKTARSLHGDTYNKALGELEAIVRRRLSTPLQVRDPALGGDQTALARELLASVPKDATVSLSDLRPPVATTGATAHTDRVVRLSEQLSEIDPAQAPVDDLISRLWEVPTRDAAERGLLIDSVELEVKERLELVRIRREIERTAREGLAWLTPFTSSDAEAYRERLTNAFKMGELTAVRAAAAEARSWGEAEGARLDGARVREALLSELQGLGYEVKVQGGVWQEGSRVAAQKPSEPNYDIQLSAAPNGAVQSKVRAYDHPGRSSGINRRDVEMEQSWCDDLARINNLLAERGMGAEITHEEGPGNSEQVPLPARPERDFPSNREREIGRKL